MARRTPPLTPPPLPEKTPAERAQQMHLADLLNSATAKLRARNLANAVLLAQQAQCGHGPLVEHFQELGRRYVHLLDQRKLVVSPHDVTTSQAGFVEALAAVTGGIRSTHEESVADASPRDRGRGGLAARPAAAMKPSGEKVCGLTAASDVGTKGVLSTHTPHPDAALLALCAQLTGMQTEWQRLYDMTSDSGPLTTDADHAWRAYSDDVWPGTRLAIWGDKPPHPDDVPGRLRTIRATTAEGQVAKARAILAMEEASGYVDCRDDAIELMHSLLRDAAGIEAHGLGADAPPLPGRLSDLRISEIHL